jgi:hypothetical protein
MQILLRNIFLYLHNNRNQVKCFFEPCAPLLDVTIQILLDTK